MANRLVKLSHTSYTPAVAEVLPRPGRCVVEYGYVGLVPNFGLSKYYPDRSVWFEHPAPRTVCYPPTPGVPGRDETLSIDSNVGWNGGAVSIAAISGDLRATFAIEPWTIGALVGLAAAPASSEDFAGVAYGLLYTGSTIRVVEDGVEKADSGRPLTGATTLKIVRVAGRITYHVDNWTYQSAKVDRRPMQLVGLLYVAGDAIDSPRLSRLATLNARSSWGWADDASRRGVSARSSWGWAGASTINDARVSVSFDVAALLSETPRGEMRVHAGDVTTTLTGGYVEVEAAGIVTTIPIEASAAGTSVIGGTLAVPLELVAAGYEYDYGVLNGVVADVWAVGVEYGDAPNAGSSYTYLGVRDAYAADPVLYASIRETLAIGDEFEVLLVLDAIMADRLVLLDSTDVTAVIQAVLRSGVRFTDNVSAVRAALLQYATNLQTGAVTRYEGFDFIGFARVGMDTYGWKADGVYRVGASTDDGELINALVDLAADEFGTASTKRMEAVFFGLATDGGVYARITTDTDQQITYRVRTRSHGTARADIGKGLSSRQWRLRLQVVDATFAELDNIEWIAGATSRRTTR